MEHILNSSRTMIESQTSPQFLPQLASCGKSYKLFCGPNIFCPSSLNQVEGNGELSKHPHFIEKCLSIPLTIVYQYLDSTFMTYTITLLVWSLTEFWFNLWRIWDQPHRLVPDLENRFSIFFYKFFIHYQKKKKKRVL